MTVPGACAPGPSKTISVRPSRSPPPAVVAPTFRLVLLLGVLVALGPFTIDMYLPALPVIGPDLGSTPAAVQLTLTGTLVGIAVGQLVVGPLSDALGRRRPLVAGVAVHVVASLLCVVAPSVTVLGVLRGFQGFGAAAASVIGLAVVRDLFSGRAAAALFSRLMLVIGASPVLAPTIGGEVLRWSNWRGVFAVLAVLGGLVMAALFGYVSGSTFVFQDQYGLSQQEFALVFGSGAVALIGATQLTARLLRRWAPRQILVAGLAIGSASGALLVAVTAIGLGDLPAGPVPPPGLPAGPRRPPPPAPGPPPGP